jgi:N-acetylmuramoyl-L-alanine amidase
MKVMAGFGLLWAGLVMAAAQSPLSKLERVWLLGHEYVRLADWARANDFQVRWLAKQELRLAGDRGTLGFTIDSRKMSLNGINVWLSVPIAARNGSAHIAAVDLRTMVHPVLFPPRNLPSRPLKHLCLDPGHGGKDPGNREGPHQEKKYTLLLAKELRAQLSKAGFKVSLTRTSDKTLDLAERTEMARRRGADLLLSLHYNSADGAGGSAVKGAEVYCMTPAHTSSTNVRGEGASTGAGLNNRFDANNMLLAYQLQKGLVRHAGLEDRGVKRARFQVLRNAEMPAVLVEAGFMTHPSESRRIYDSTQRQKTAQAIVQGLVAYKRIVDVAGAVAQNR